MFDKPLQRSSVGHSTQLGCQTRPQATYDETPAVYVINGDPSMRRSLEAIVRSTRWDVHGFCSAADFLSCRRSRAPACLVVDTVLPDSCGLELQDRLNKSESGMSVIFVMNRPDIPAAVRAVKAGAIEVLTNPIDSEVLLRALQEAILRSEAELVEHSKLATLRSDYASLTNREREVMMMVVSGLLNKQVGARLGISEITVKAHRGQVMRKMKANSFADLVNKAAYLSRMSH